MIKKRRKKRNQKYVVTKKEEIWCSVCKVTSVISNDNVEELVCGDCFAKQLWYSEPHIQPKTVVYKKGWNLKKKYKAPDGKIFHFGKQITGETNVRTTTKTTPKTKSVSKRLSTNSKSVLSKSNKKSHKQKQK